MIKELLKEYKSKRNYDSKYVSNDMLVETYLTKAFLAGLEIAENCIPEALEQKDDPLYAISGYNSCRTEMLSNLEVVKIANKIL